MKIRKRHVMVLCAAVLAIAGLVYVVHHADRSPCPLEFFPSIFVMGKSFFEGDKKTPEVAVVADPYKDVREPLVSWLKGVIGKPGKAYQGELVAQPTAQEDQSLSFLNQYAAAPASSTTTAGKKQIEDTLSGSFDPTKSPYYQAVKAEMGKNLEDSQKNIADWSAGGGRYWTGARLGEQREAASDYTRSLNTVLGQLANEERNRQIEVLPQALQYGTSEEESPLRKTAALQEFGSLPRDIQQAIDQALYNEFLRTEQDWPLAIGQLSAGVQQAPLYGEVGYDQSLFNKLISPLISALGTKAGTSIAANLFKGSGTAAATK